MPSHELYHIGIDQQIKTYIIGEPIFSQKVQCYPSEADISAAPSQVFEGRVIRKSRISSSFDERVRKSVILRRQDNPLQRYIVISTLEGTKIPGIFKHRLGTARFCPAPLANRAAILSIQPSCKHSDLIQSAENTYFVLKMIPFERKLTLLQSLSSSHLPSSHQMLPFLEQAILSDLADEQAAFSQDRWTGKWNKNSIRRSLTLLRTLSDCNWEGAPQTHETLQSMMLRFRAFVSLTRLKKDIFPNRRQRILANATKGMIDSRFQAILGERKSWKPDYTNVHKKPLSNLPKKELWALIRNPYYNNFKFYQDNWDASSLIINTK